MFNENNNKKAFTLMEVVIILFVASVGVMAALSLALRSVYFQNVEKELFTATFLADEGLELMTNIRDTNIIMENDYDNWDGLTSAGFGLGENFFKLDYFALTATSVDSISSSTLQQNDNGFYIHDNNYDDSIFNRMVTTQATTTSSTSVEVWLNWKSRDEEYDYKLETILYDLSF